MNQTKFPGAYSPMEKSDNTTNNKYVDNTMSGNEHAVTKSKLRQRDDVNGK